MPVFDPARLRAHRHLAGLDRAALATAAHTTPATLSAIETGHTTPGPELAAALASALGCAVADLHTTADPTDNTGYWDVVCAALPPLTPTEISTVATVLRRVGMSRRSARGSGSAR